MAGLFFCLAPADGAGLLFLPGGVSATHKHLQRSFCRPCNFIRPKRKKRSQGFAWAFPLICPIPAHNNTADTQAAYTQLASRWRAYHQAQHPHRYHAPAPRWALYRPAQPPYYNKVYKSVANRRPCQRRRGSASGLHPVQGHPGG